MFLLLDANVLIDFVDAGDEILGVIGTCVGSIQVARPVLAEVAQLTVERAAQLNIVVHDLEAEFMSACLKHKLPGLSFQDQVCLELARQHTWTCVTNDKRLRQACETRDVAVLWGLELLLRGVDAGGMSREDAIRIAESIAAANPYLKSVLPEFRSKLGR